MSTSTIPHHTGSTRRAAGVAATAALASLLTVTPAFARPDPGPAPTPERRTNESEIIRKNLDEMRARDARTAPSPTVITIDDNAVEYLQVALGALGGMAALGAVVAAGSVRRHHAHGLA